MRLTSSSLGFSPRRRGWVLRGTGGLDRLLVAHEAVTLGPVLEVSERTILMALIRVLRSAARDEGCPDVVIELIEAVELEVSSDAFVQGSSMCVGRLRVLERSLAERDALLSREAGELARAVEVAVASRRAPIPVGASD